MLQFHLEKWRPSYGHILLGCARNLLRHPSPRPPGAEGPPPPRFRRRPCLLPRPLPSCPVFSGGWTSLARRGGPGMWPSCRRRRLTSCPCPSCGSCGHPSWSSPSSQRLRLCSPWRRWPNPGSGVALIGACQGTAASRPRQRRFRPPRFSCLRLLS
jgi:hypothetical protein